MLGRILSIAALVGVARAYCPGFMAQEESCSCFAYTDGAVIKCSGNNGPAVVEKLKTVQTEIRELTIENANIVEIGPRAFRNLRIKTLNLNYNRIRSIHPDAFRGLEKTLTTLSLSHNKLTEVPTDALMDMENLLVLNLKCNNIGDIYGTVFRNVTRLIELNLGCNQICSINGPAFESVKSSLQSLVLDSNCLKTIPSEALRNFENLLAIHLQQNQIEKIDDLQLMNLKSLIMIRLTGNQIRTINRNGFNNVPNLRYLYLDSNQLTTIEPNTLQQFKYLEIVDLSFNNIGEIPNNAFKGLEHLMQLNLEGNSIKDIAPGSFANTPLLLLLLAQNCLSSVNQQMFQGIPFLRQLTLSRNNIRLIQPFSFSHLPSLHLLDVSHNKIQVIQPGALTSSTHVTVLLQENPVVCTQQGYHIVQGGQPIQLLNEPNEICSSNYVANATDQCPTRTQIPTPPVCCSVYEQTTQPPTTTTEFQETTTPVSTTEKVWTTLPPALTTEAPVRRYNHFSPAPTRPRTTDRRALNMERFWALSRGRRPSPEVRTRSRLFRTTTEEPTTNLPTRTRLVPISREILPTPDLFTPPPPEIPTPNTWPEIPDPDETTTPELLRLVPSGFQLPEGSVPVPIDESPAAAVFQPNSGLLRGQQPQIPPEVLKNLPEWVRSQFEQGKSFSKPIEDEEPKTPLRSQERPEISFSSDSS